MGEQAVPRSLGDKLRGLLIRPDRTTATLAPNLGEGTLVVMALIVTAGVRAALEVAYTAGVGDAGLAIAGAAIGITMAWLSLTAALHLIGRALGGRGSYRTLLALMGYAATPMTLTALVSTAIYIVSPMLLPNLGGAGWGSVHTLIGWVGMTWGWPGLLSYYALRHGQRLSRGKAGGTVGAVYILLLLGWFLPMLVPGLFE